MFGLRLALPRPGGRGVPTADAWFDRPRAAAEARPVLVQGGAIVICHLDWLPLRGNDVEATEQLILAHNSRWGAAGGRGVYPRWARDLAEADFGDIETFSYD